MADTETLLRAFLSSDNSVRRAAEAQIEALRRANVDTLPLLFAQVAQVAAATELRAAAAVLLRRVVTAEEADGSEHWIVMSSAARAQLQAQLLACVQTEADTYIRRLLVDTTAEVAIIDMDALQQEWPALWALVYAWAQSPQYAQQECALQFLEYLGGPVATRMQDSMAALTALLHSRLCDASAPVPVRTQALAAAVSVLTEFRPRDSATDSFAALIGPSLLLLRDLIVAQRDESSRAVSTYIVDIAETHTNLLKPHIADLLSMAKTFAADTRVDNATRVSLVEALVLVSERSPGVARKVPEHGFLRVMLPILFQMLMEHGEEEETLEQWEASDTSYFDSTNEGCNVDAAEDALGRVLYELGGTHVLPVLLPMINDMLQRAGPSLETWKHRFAALNALSHASDILSDKTAMQQQLATQLVVYTKDAHPRIRHAALGVIANLCTYQGPAFQRRTHSIICPALLVALSDPSKRVRTQAALATAQFTDRLHAELDGDVVQPYVRDLLVACFAVLNSSDGWQQEQALAAISALVSCAGQLLAPHFAELMPPMRALLASCEPSDELLALATCSGREHSIRKARQAAQDRVHHLRRMKGRALECASLLGETVPPEVFRPDAALLMDMIVRMLQVAAVQRNAAAHTAAVAASAASTSNGGSAEAAAAAAAAASSSALASLSSMGTPIEDDPVTAFVWESIGRLAAVMQADFAPFIEMVLPPLLDEASRLMPSVFIQSGRAGPSGVYVPSGQAAADGDGNDDSDDDDPEYTVVERADVKIRVKSAPLHDKQAALHGVSAMVAHIPGKLMAPYSLRIVQVLLPLLDLRNAPLDEIRTRAAATLSECLTSACSVISAAHVIDAYNVTTPGAAHLSPHGAVSKNALDLLAIVSEAVVAIKESIEQERTSSATFHETLDSIIIALMHCITEVCTVKNYADGETVGATATYIATLTPDVLKSVTETAILVRRDVVQRRAIRAGELRLHEDEYDEDAKQALQEDDDDDFELAFHTVELIGSMIKTHAQTYLPIYNALVAPLVTDMHHPACVAQDRRLAVFLMSDVLEFLGDRAWDGTGVPYLNTYGPAMMSSTRDRDDAVRQAAVFGLGAAAESCPAGYRQLVGNAVASLVTCISSPVTGEWTEVEDNAVTALGKVLIHQVPTGFSGAEGIPSRRDLLRLFLSKLPLTHDRDEGVVALSMLCTWIESGDADLLGPLDACATPGQVELLAQCVRVFGCALGDHTYANISLLHRIGKLLLRVQSSVSAEVQGAVWSVLSSVQRDALLSAARAAAGG